MFAYFHSDGNVPTSSDKLIAFEGGVQFAVLVESHQLQMNFFFFSLLSFQELQITAINDLIQFSNWDWK